MIRGSLVFHSVAVAAGVPTSSGGPSLSSSSTPESSTQRKWIKDHQQLFGLKPLPSQFLRLVVHPNKHIFVISFIVLMCNMDFRENSYAMDAELNS